MKLKIFSVGAAISIAVIIFSNAGKLFACGPDFPNNLLDAGDNAVVQPPIADFSRELARMHLVTTSIQAVPLVDGQKYYEQSAKADLADLVAALKHDKVSGEPAAAIVTFHTAQRRALNAYLADRHMWEISAGWDYADGHYATPTNPPPVFPELQIAPGLPWEFAWYFKGYCAWVKGEQSQAMAYWQNILNLPPEERHYKSTWAMFMLGKYYAAVTNDDKDAEALKDFTRVRALVKNGFADSLGLATASIGLEAKIYLRQHDYEPAIELYLEQFAAGDPSAVSSLCLTAARVLEETNLTSGQLSVLAKNIHTRRLITAYLISQRSYASFMPARTAWLDAVEKAGVRDVDSAEQLALAAYQVNDMAAARRWIKLASNRPVGQWLEAKLLMRDGKVDAAARLLSKLAGKFPVADSDTNISPSLTGNLFVIVSYMWNERISAAQQVSGELGVLRLTQREYAEALDALLRSGYWMDAAYIAERVLTLDELKTYVNRNWPETTDAKDKLPGFAGKNMCQEIRYLLARRLARQAHYAEALKYYPADLQTNLNVFVTGLRAGANDKLSDLQRGRALFVAASMARTNGMELFGTELEPDWAIYGGDYTFDPTIWQTRATNALTDIVNTASTNELARAMLPQAEPDERFHYRMQAADLAWAAAKLMPDNSPETAQMLCAGGSWVDDAKKADRFYKALVRRCRQTALGAEADSIRWFPDFDENGNVISQRLRLLKLTPEVTNAVSRNGIGEIFSTEFPVPGIKYAVHRNDTMTGIAAAAMRMDQRITVEKVLGANPGLRPNRLRIGQLIMIPAGDSSDNRGETNDVASLLPADGSYIIQAGDTLAKIVVRLQKSNPTLTLEKLKAANPGLDGSHIRVGQRVVLPGAENNIVPAP